jgi:predicted nucleic acid-binding protein
LKIALEVNAAPSESEMVKRIEVIPIPFYAVLYLITAKLYKCKKVTFDKKLISSVSGTDLENYLSEP